MATRVLTDAQISHLEALKKKHSFLSEQVEEAHKTPSATDFYLRQLKKEKFHVKQEMEALRACSASA